MTKRPKTTRNLLRAAIVAALFAAPVAPAQQAGDKPAAAPEASKPMPIMQPVPSNVPGRPDVPNAEVAKRLTNVAPHPFGLPADQLPKAGDQFKKYKEKPVVVYCDTGATGGAAARTLAQLGFTKAVTLRGGLAAWRAENLPVTRG